MTWMEKVSTIIKKTLIEKPLRMEKFEIRFSNGIRAVCVVKIYEELLENTLSVFPEYSRGKIPLAEFAAWHSQIREVASFVPFPLSASVSIGNSHRVIILSPALAQSVGAIGGTYAS